MVVYSPVSAQVPITAVVSTVTLNVNKPYCVAGEPITFSGAFMQDGVGVPNTWIDIYLLRGSLSYIVFTVQTDANGNYSKTLPLPWTTIDVEGVRGDIAGYVCDFFALNYATNAKSGTVTVTCAYPTRIRDLTAPAKVAVNEKFVVSGNLEMQLGDYTTPGAWMVILGRIILIYIDTSLVGSPITGAGGLFSQSDVSIGASGTYIIKAVFAGEGLTLGLVLSPVTAEAGVDVPGLEVSPSLIWSVAAALIGGFTTLFGLKG